MKTCSKCKTEKSIDQFNKNVKRKDGLTSWCKICVREKSDQHYNSIEGKKQWKNNVDNRQKRRRELNFKLREGKYCEKCKEDHPSVLDFHHLDPKGKDFSISEGLKLNKSESEIISEIEKCVVLCVNCHRKFHYLEKQNNITIQEYLK